MSMGTVDKDGCLGAEMSPQESHKAPPGPSG
eukprot:CAMPEP_0180799282 /NCGR_PEP_ID=MMETSP1038_2-20121128/58450_1 /TAXON_ID=632150 /ORGANISM="Azadinium spinosum, Strain 3D9" /LENGTH=30 /DNA_ID= /DNA_START= /DNA_END= /DNA_ORIENTATION=